MGKIRECCRRRPSVSTSDTGSFPYSTCFGTNQRWECVRFNLSSQNELVDNVKVHEPLGSSDHNQIHLNIKVKTGTTYKNNGGGTSTKANIKRCEHI